MHSVMVDVKGHMVDVKRNMVDVKVTFSYSLPFCDWFPFQVDTLFPLVISSHSRYIEWLAPTPPLDPF